MPNKEVAVIGVGVTPFGVHYEKGFYDLIIDAVAEATRDAGVRLTEIEAAWLGAMEPRITAQLADAGPAAAEALGLYPRPVTRVANYCTSGMEAVRAAALAVAAGQYELVLAVGAEKMRDVPPRGSLVDRTVNLNHPTLTKGRTAPGQFALLATRYLHQYGYGRELLADVAIKNHYHGSLNPKAHFRAEVTREQVLKAPLVSEPLGLLDCTPTTDGAAAVILTTRRRAEAMGADYVLLRGMGVATTGGYFSVQFEPGQDFLGFRATREAARMAYAQAGITDPRRELDVVECHDCFTITELVNCEDLGLCAPGEAARLLQEKVTWLGGELPVNPSGGLQSCGHPVGATGVRMVAEITDQLRNRAGQRQVPGARTGLAHTLGGPGIVSAVMILQKP